MMTRAEFATAIAPLSAATGREVSRNQCAVWFDRLRDLPLAALKAAVLRCLDERESEWLPPIATLRRYAFEAQHGIPLSAEEALLRLKLEREHVDRAIGCVSIAAVGCDELDRLRGEMIRAMRERLGPDICGLLDRMGWSSIDERRFTKLWERRLTRNRLRALPADSRPPGLTGPQAETSLAAETRLSLRAAVKKTRAMMDSLALGEGGKPETPIAGRIGMDA